MPAARVFSIADQIQQFDTVESVETIFKDYLVEDLEEVFVNGNTFSTSAAKALGTVLEKTRNLKVACLSAILAKKPVEEALVSFPLVCSPLIGSTSLIELNLSDNAFGANLYPAIVPVLSQVPTVSVLKLSNNGFGPKAGTEVAKALIETSKRRQTYATSAPSFRVLTCARNRLEDGSASYWGELISLNPELQKVKLSNNGFREPGVKALAKGLAQCHDLRYLSLRDCTSRNADSDDPPEERGSRYLAQAIKAAPHLEVLDLSDSELTEVGSWEIINVLAGGAHKELHTLLLENNEIGEEHYKTLLEVVSTKLPKLTLLSLVLNNDLDNEHVGSIVELIKARGGRAIIEDPEDDEDLLNDGDDAKKEGRFFAALGGSLEGQEEVDAAVAELDELMKTKFSLSKKP